MEEKVLAIYGMGYVGLTLAATFANAGIPVIGIDVSEPLIAQLNRGTRRPIVLCMVRTISITYAYTTLHTKALHITLRLALPCTLCLALRSSCAHHALRLLNIASGVTLFARDFAV